MNLSLGMPLMLTAQAIAAFFAAFLGILLWSRTRETSWMCVIAAALFSFGLLMLKILSRFGILPVDLLAQDAVPLWYGLLRLLPPLLTAMGLGAAVYHNRSY